MTVLIIGGSGFLGAELVRQAVSAGRHPAATYHSRPGDYDGAAWHHLDLRDPLHLEEVLTTVAPDAVINVTSGGADWTITAEGGIRLALTAAEAGNKLRSHLREYFPGFLAAFQRTRDGVEGRRAPIRHRSTSGPAGQPPTSSCWASLA
ncbi:NAD-dependent epimerase/dehydratase family protein [Streptomyces sp. NPDC096311]|uniref:NAD-dependent epimerase/dehydratase family protein n=1 Tax=Streptomyces sp. NPDC096311 TaxID=3366083 RepID=UPI00381D9DF4